MRYIIDRFENEITILEDEQKKMIQVASIKLPKGIREGDIIILEKGIYIIDEEKSTKRKEDIKKVIDELWN